MSKILLRGVMAAAVALAGTAASEQERAETPLRLEVNLADGSRIIGVPDIESLPVETAYAKMEIPLKQVVTVKLVQDRETAALELKNGDKLKGIVNLGTLKLETVFGKVSVGIEHLRDLRVLAGGGAMPAGEGSLSFGGVNWSAWHTLFEVQGDRLVSRPKARPGFNYGHGGSGRGPALMTNIGSPDWKDYSVELEFGMRGVDPAFNPHGLPLDYRSGSIMFHVADAKESWNERGGSMYALSLVGDGSWTLTCAYNSYCPAASGYCNPTSDGSRTLAQGKGLTHDPKAGNKIRIELRGTRIQIWVDGTLIADVRDEKMGETVGGQTLDHGGVGVGWGHDSMGWIRNFSAKRL